MKKTALVLLAALVALLAMVALIWQLNLGDEPDPSAPVADLTMTPQLVAQGAYLARAGNCAACHTTRGGVPYAGGRGIDTPFGTVYAPNLTPDGATGIGQWSSSDFWRALHNGRSKSGRFLYPAFPYTSYTAMARADSDALFAFLKSLPATAQAATPHELRWPYKFQAALAVWRALYFRPAAHSAEPAKSAEWNRGAYLVQVLGHCGACHSQRNALGADEDRLALSGGLMALQNWYAPALTSLNEAGLANWQQEDIVRLLQSGVAPHRTVLGPMADVVLQSTQHLSLEDLAAMATYLKALPQTTMTLPAQTTVAGNPPTLSRLAVQGAHVYDTHCAQCHGEQGLGVAGAYPALAGNRAVRMAVSVNLIQAVLYGGFAPATAGNPRPFGMPPYVLALTDADIAAVLTYIRTAWGNRGGEVTELEVSRLRAISGG